MAGDDSAATSAGAVFPAAGVPRWRRWARRVNPLGLVPAAIFEKEVRSQGRRWGTYVGRGLYAALMLALLILVFIGVMDGRAQWGRGARALQELQELAPSMTLAVLWFQYVMLALMGPLMAGPSLCDERRAGTLATLLTTPLTAGQIVLGKLLSAMVQIVILAALATPMLLVIRVFGGVPGETILAGLALAISTSFLGASLAILSSVRAKRGTTAAVVGFLTALALHVGPLMVIGILALWSGGRGPAPSQLTWGFVACGPAALGFLTSELTGGASPPIGMGVVTLWMANCAYSVSLGSLAIFWAIVRLRRVMVAIGAGAPAVAARKSKRARTTPAPAIKSDIPTNGEAATDLATIAGPSRSSKDDEQSGRLGRERGAVSDRPVLWREVRQPLFARRRDFWIVTGAFVAIYAAIFLKEGIDEAVFYAVPTGIVTFIVLVQAATMSSSTITSEREGRTWDVLLTSRLSPWEVVFGKAVGSLRRLVYAPAIVGLLLATAGVVSGCVRPAFLPLALVIVSAPAIFLTCTGVLASLICRKSTHASALNIGVALVLWVGVPIVTGVLGFHRSGTFLTVTNPMPLMIAAIDGAIHSRAWGRNEVLSFNGPLEHSMNLTEFALVVAVYWVVYVALGLGALRLGAAVFNDRTGRSS